MTWRQHSKAVADTKMEFTIKGKVAVGCVDN